MAYGMPMRQGRWTGGTSSVAGSRLCTMQDGRDNTGPPHAGRAIPPGSGRRKGAAFPKGRVLKAAELAAVRALLGDRPRARALLIEYLHLIQDREGCLPEGHLHAL